MTRRIPVVIFLLAVSLGCSDSPVTMPTPDGDAIRLIAEATRNLPGRPQGIVVTPDGRFVVIATYIGFEILVLDAETLETVTSRGMLNPWGMTIDPGGGRVWVAGKHGVTALGLPGLEELAQFPVGPRTLVQGSHPNTLYGIDPNAGGVLRFNSVTGEILASLAHPSLVSDSRMSGSRRRPNTPGGQRLRTPAGAGSPGSQPGTRNSTPLGMLGCHTARRRWEGLVLSGEEDSHGQFPSASVVDWRTGDSRQISVPRPSGSVPWTEYGYGNPWVRVDDLIFAPGRQGILVADARSGEILEFLEGTPSTEGTVYCCEIAWDAVRKRLLIVGDYLDGDHSSGKLVSYRMER